MQVSNMFKVIHSESQILNFLEKRKNVIKSLEKLPDINSTYINYIKEFKGVEITPDIILMSYEEALKENEYLKENFSFIQENYWIFGVSGQGDSWLIEKKTNKILFFDHNQGEFNKSNAFIHLGIGFCAFIRMAFLYKDLEEFIDKNEFNREHENQFKKELNSLSPNLYDCYPYKYI